jgi:Arc/MetJ-type ribon-helix-helix transcriptional regulator
MSSYVGIRIPDNIAEKMDEIVSKGLYRNRQDFILEALRDKLSKSPREEFEEVPA